MTTNDLHSRCEAQKDRIIKIAMNAGHAGIYFGTAEEPHALRMWIIGPSGKLIELLGRMTVEDLEQTSDAAIEERVSGSTSA